MGAGKSSVGPLLARRLGRQFLDLDDYIEQREQRSIAELFDAGESHFRSVEHAALAASLERASREPIVLALGGGAFVQPQNLQLLESHHALSVFLDAPVAELWKRCQLQAKTRPLMQDENQFRQLYKSRRSSYMASSLRIDTAAKDVEAVTDAITEKLAKELRPEGE
jgi:shikimate kinase